ncbi:tRNA adenosine(34) deaminase TadA [Thioalkalivibrio sp. ALJ16]|uniref:tRNA adenosine(34) deaminase TadA n=1 Tax=Thioalkalivibrio sp. ALJ16 TaxID=1158762 RepID=UPI00035DF022|nr:tRNA adenosine(34) deaminase TadA [Thioalkalivibrio sp. ALJ16]
MSAEFEHDPRTLGPGDRGPIPTEAGAHAFWMELALAQAERAAATGEVPVGAVLVDAEGHCLAAAHNAPIGLHDATAHAEIRVLRAAGQRCSNYRLTGTTLYVTLEPCSMCVGAIIHARVGRLVFAASDPRTGATGGAIDLLHHPAHNHRLECIDGIAAERSSELLRNFFRSRRKR